MPDCFGIIFLKKWAATLEKGVLKCQIALELFYSIFWVGHPWKRESLILRWLSVFFFHFLRATLGKGSHFLKKLYCKRELLLLSLLEICFLFFMLGNPWKRES